MHVWLLAPRGHQNQEARRSFVVFFPGPPNRQWGAAGGSRQQSMMQAAAPTGDASVVANELSAATEEKLCVDVCDDACVAEPAESEVEAALAIVEAKRTAIIAAIVAARLEHSKTANDSIKERKARPEDFFASGTMPAGFKEAAAPTNGEKVKDYRLQGEYGQKKFIKP